MLSLVASRTSRGRVRPVAVVLAITVALRAEALTFSASARRCQAGNGTNLGFNTGEDPTINLDHVSLGKILPYSRLQPAPERVAFSTLERGRIESQRAHDAAPECG